MKKNMLAVLLFLVTLALLSADASAMYNPATGTFMQRDPGSGGKINAPGVAGVPSIGSQFIPRDPTRQYTDGMNLYQYVKSLPTSRYDPMGLGCCGPDITAQLTSLQANLAAKWDPNSQIAKDVCSHINNINGWDIAELGQGGDDCQACKSEAGCGTGKPCDRTVEVNGKCYDAHDVNYIWYGWLRERCGGGALTTLGTVATYNDIAGGVETIFGGLPWHVLDRLDRAEDHLVESVMWTAQGYVSYQDPVFPNYVSAVSKNCPLCNGGKGKLYSGSLTGTAATSFLQGLAGSKSHSFKVQS